MRFDTLALAIWLATAPAWPPTSENPTPSETRTSAQEPQAGARIRLNFKGATFDQVIDFFSRATGLPVVREADVPEGTLDYLAPEEYTLDEALEILNIILHAKGVASAISRGRTTVMISFGRMSAGSSPTKTGMSSRAISVSFWR